MSFWRQFTRGFARLNRHAADQEIADEINHYLEEATATFMAPGSLPRKLGGPRGETWAVRPPFGNKCADTGGRT